MEVQLTCIPGYFVLTHPITPDPQASPNLKGPSVPQTDASVATDPSAKKFHISTSSNEAALNPDKGMQRQRPSVTDPLNGKSHQSGGASSSCPPVKPKPTQSKGKQASPSNHAPFGSIQPIMSSDRAHAKKGEIPCRAWKSGGCAKGDKCWFGHDPQVSDFRDLE